MTRRDQIVVVKLGGNAMTDDVIRKFAANVVALRNQGMLPIVVHGGGPQIDQALAASGISVEFANGRRVTSKEALLVVESVLMDRVNHDIVAEISNAGCEAVGLSGKKDHLFSGTRMGPVFVGPDRRPVDYGFVGEPDEVHADILSGYIISGLIPVIAPIGVGKHGETLNMNADTVAGAIAGALKADHFILMTNVDGVLDKEKRLIPHLTEQQAKDLIADGTISGGMVPKVETAIVAVEKGANSAIIIDGRIDIALEMNDFINRKTGTSITSC
uniref:acetylglutamate kinase n=1 Tax=Spongospora subterranea TaxID=70186 RepID=A0A0H5RRX3_9EUKA|eukprot:CRZ11474.1 hypothetical protein [Spongospora subterranea]